jgi:hypothetical protein
MAVEFPLNEFDIAFNARGLTPEQVATHFIPPLQFRRLADPENALVVGPRGTGKTTLLKMLLSAALERWAHRDAADVRRRVSYSSFFVATDRTWVEQVEAVADTTIFDDIEAELIVKAAFTLQVLSSLVRVMQYRASDISDQIKEGHRRVSLPRADEADIVTDLAHAWHLSPRIPSLAGLHKALALASSEFHSFVSAEKQLAAAGRGDRLAGYVHLHLNYRQAALLAIDFFNTAVNQPGARWALLCDELEIAPACIRDQLLMSLRGTDPVLINKLSLAPYSPGGGDLGTVLGARADHDYVPISLAYGRESSSYQFCEGLVQSVLVRRGWDPKPAATLFGSSGYDVGPEDDGVEAGYGRTSGWARRFRSLAQKDPTFVQYLDDANIDIERINELPEAVRAATARKVGPLVAVRDEFKSDGRDSGGRSRKKSTVPTIYTGDRAFFAMLEGNPRNVIGVVSRLVDGYSDSRGLSRRAQARELAALRNRFRAFLATIPLGDVGRRTRSRGMLAFLDAIGRAFKALTVDAPFDDDPPGTFIIDEDVPESFLDSLGAAVNAGAVIYLPEAGADPHLKSLRGGRFRLAYLFAPDYNLPIRRGRPVALSSLLLRKPPRSRKTGGSLRQGDLFTEETLENADA